MFSLPNILSPYSDSVTYFIAVPSINGAFGPMVQITVCVKQGTPAVTVKRIYRAIQTLVNREELYELVYGGPPEDGHYTSVFLRVSVVTDRRTQ